MRTFTSPSMLTEGNLALALAPALTPTGIDQSPSFFRGFVVYPQVMARGLLALADITSTRYFNYTPVVQRDPVLSAQGDRLRAECFSACNGVYARLDLLGSGFDGSIALGTTNVDIGMELRSALAQLKQADKLHVNIGTDGLTALPISKTDEKLTLLNKRVQERPVQMPNRWIRALGNAAEIHSRMKPVFTVSGAQAQIFVATLPPATGKAQSGWLTYSSTGITLTSRRSSSAVFISGLHRLSAFKRLLEQRWAIGGQRLQTALGLLAVSGKLGYDAHERAWFHRELPDEPERALKDNPRVAAARKLVDTVRDAGEHRWLVHSNGGDYPVFYDPNQGVGGAKCGQRPAWEQGVARHDHRGAG